MKDIITKIIIGIVFVIMEIVFINWNTNSFLMKWDEPVAVETAGMGDEGRRAVGELDRVTSLQQVQEKSYVNIYFLEAEKLEPMGIYKLLSVDYEGIVRVGKTFNIFPREMFTEEIFLPKVYRGMYGQFYKATLSDGSNVLVLLGCNNEKDVVEGEYTDIIARYYPTAVSGKEAEYSNEVSARLEELEAQMDEPGYINLGDVGWAKRHDFGLFAMSFMKALLSIVIAVIVASIVTSFIWKDKKKE